MRTSIRTDSGGMPAMSAISRAAAALTSAVAGLPIEIVGLSPPY